MPRRHRNVSICGQSDSDCVNNITRQLQSRENENFHCNCMYGCYDLKYDSELSSTPIFNRAPLLDQFGVAADDMAVLHVYYENLIYSSQKKEQLVGFTEFLCKVFFRFEFLWFFSFSNLIMKLNFQQILAVFWDCLWDSALFQ